MALLLDNCEGILLSLESHKSVPAPFLTKTYQLVDDPNTDHIVSWGEDDSTFVVWRPPEFARDLLPNYFKHNNFSSFVRQLNTYGFRKIVPERWEFANEFFKKGEKHLLCEIHRRKTAHPQQIGMNHHHHHHHSPMGVNVPSFFPFSSTSSRVSISPPNDSDEQANWCDSPPLTSPIRGATSVMNNGANYNSSVTALSEDNERLRRSNNMLMSELAHMKKLYNDIIYFVQNHVKPVAPSNSYSSSLLLCNTPQASTATPISTSNVSTMQRPMNQLLGYYSNNPKQATQPQPQTHAVNSPTNTSRSSITFVEGPSSNSSKTKLFGVSLQSKKRVHPEYGSNPTNLEMNKARLVLEKDDLGLNLMPPSSC
ncbi:heat stress transcription factor B-4-like [Gastrolobium bilobum]|uniref:heat stress transcription factor B-4-like n=1 Tax=Gastrolobium bilobum TaxID=150636 RepID=UPI002AB32099|nr:heat stress transcription factor B-4-like [Gastrolobium bilobum]